MGNRQHRQARFTICCEGQNLYQPIYDRYSFIVLFISSSPMIDIDLKDRGIVHHDRSCVAISDWPKDHSHLWQLP